MIDFRKRLCGEKEMTAETKTSVIRTII